MIRRPPRSTLSSSSAASDVYKRQISGAELSFFLFSDLSDSLRRYAPDTVIVLAIHQYHPNLHNTSPGLVQDQAACNIGPGWGASLEPEKLVQKNPWICESNPVKIPPVQASAIVPVLK